MSDMYTLALKFVFLFPKIWMGLCYQIFRIFGPHQPVSSPFFCPTSVTQPSPFHSFPVRVTQWLSVDLLVRADLRFLIFFFGRVLTSLIHNRTNRLGFDTGKSSRYLHQVLLIVPTTKVGPCHHARTFTTLNSFWLVWFLESTVLGT